MDGGRVEPGGLSDYQGLANGHYRAPCPAVPVLTLRYAWGGRTVGAMVIAAPVLNGRWRTCAWPGWLDGLDKRAAAAEVNAQLRCIARLAVAPAWRGRGVGSALVRAYLAEPLTARTEALSAMASLSPVFERAGMRRVANPPGRAGRRVLGALRERGVPVWSLADPAVRRRVSRDPLIAGAFGSLAAERWREGKRRPAREQVERLWGYVAGRPAAFVAG